MRRLAQIVDNQNTNKQLIIIWSITKTVNNINLKSEIRKEKMFCLQQSTRTILWNFTSKHLIIFETTERPWLKNVERFDTKRDSGHGCHVSCFKGVYFCAALSFWAHGIFAAVPWVATEENLGAAILPVCYPVLSVSLSKTVVCLRCCSLFFFCCVLAFIGI